MDNKNKLKVMILGTTLLLASLLATGCGDKKEAKYPNKPVTIIVPSAVGGTADIHARLVAPYLEKALGQQFVVVNKPGAGSAIGHREIAHAKPDGYTIGIVATPESPVNTALRAKEAGYKNDDFALVASFTRMPGALQVMADGPFKNINDFVAYAKANPGKLTVGVSSDAWMLHVLELEQAFGIKLNPIVVKSGGEGNNALMGKHIMAHMGGSAFAATGADKGIKAILLTGGSKRIAALPDAPTMLELGHNISYEMIKAFAVPKGTPNEIVETLRNAMREISKNPEFAKKVEGSGEIFGYLDKPDLDSIYKQSCERISAQIEKYRKAFVQQ